MDNIIEFNDFSLASCGGSSDMKCWLCQKGSTARVVFCDKCGAIQSVKPMDHFSRLGLERRIDIDAKSLDKHYLSLRQTLRPEKMSIRGMVERGYAAKQLEALEEAYNTLSDPLHRGKYWVFLHNKETNAAKSENPEIIKLRGELETAAEAQDYDRVAQKSGQAMEQGIMNLMHALRSQNWSQANDTLSELELIESILKNARTSRAQLTPDGGGDGISSVK